MIVAWILLGIVAVDLVFIGTLLLIKHIQTRQERKVAKHDFSKRTD